MTIILTIVIVTLENLFKPFGTVDEFKVFDAFFFLADEAEQIKKADLVLLRVIKQVLIDKSIVLLFATNMLQFLQFF